MRLLGNSMIGVMLAAALPLGIVHARDAARPSFMTLGAAGDPPRGYVAMCRDLPELCGLPVDADAGGFGEGGNAALCARAAPLVAAPSPAQVSALPILLATPVKWPGLPANCTDRPQTAPAAARPPLDLKQLKQVNILVNHHVRQELDATAAGQDEQWRPSGVGRGAVGDCEDLALEKMVQLQAMGYPRSATALAVAYRRGAGLHVVLVVRTQSGDMILDNMTDAIKPWHQVPYNWLRVQAPDDPNRWHRII